MQQLMIVAVELAIRKFNQLRMEEEDYYRMRQVEKTLIKILLYIFSQGSLHKIRCCNELFLIAASTATLPSNNFMLNVKEFEKVFVGKLKNIMLRYQIMIEAMQSGCFFFLSQKTHTV